MASALVEKKRPPPTLLYIARRAFAGCMQLCTFHKTGKRTTWRGPYAEANAFDKCGQLDIPKWIHFLPPNTNSGCDMWVDDFYEELRKDLH